MTKAKTKTIISSKTIILYIPFRYCKRKKSQTIKLDSFVLLFPPLLQTAEAERSIGGINRVSGAIFLQDMQLSRGIGVATLHSFLTETTENSGAALGFGVHI